VFEADVQADKIMIFNLFGDGKNGDGSKLYFYDNSGTWGFNVGDDWRSTSLKSGEWIKIRIECEGTTVSLYANDTLVVETTQSNFTGIKKVSVYTYSGGAGGYINIDNVKCGFVK
jgi:hypothetical protein